MFFAFIYIFYYRGGDTTSYYLNALPFIKLFFEDPAVGLRIIFSEYSVENWSYFTTSTGYPVGFIYRDSQTFMVSKLIMPVLMLSFNSYFLSTIIFAAISYVGSWKLFRLFQNFTDNDKAAAISALMLPSVLFWGTGISKDTITFACAAYLVYSFYYIVVRRDFNLLKLLFAFLSIYLILSIKPYIILILIPGLILWGLSAPISRIKNLFLRRITLPVIIVISAVLFILIFSNLGSVLGEYSSDQILEKAVVTQNDLKQEYYGGNTFDIGVIEPTFFGILSKVPIATFYGLYGPTLFQVRNIVMLLSSLENTILAFLTLRLLVKVRIRSIARRILDNPIFLFCIVFTIGFGFSIGLTTPNFGALVRFKIPLMPFFVFFLLGMNSYKNKTNHQ